MRPVTFNWLASDTAAIAALQTLGAAGSLILNGTQIFAPSTMQGAPYFKQDGIERVVTLTSAGNLSAANITVTGYDLRGNLVSETRAGPNANTVATTQQFTKVTSVSSNAALGTAMSVGTGDTGNTNWVETDYHVAPNNITVAVSGVSGTVSVTAQNTLADAQAAAPVAGDIFALAAITAAAANVQASYTVPPRFVRAINASGSGAFKFTVLQAGI